MRKVHKKMSNKKQIFTAIIAVLISVTLVTVAVYAVTTVGNDVTVGGTLTVTGATTLNGNATLGNADSDYLTVNASTTFATSTIFSGSVTISEGALANSTIVSADIKDGEIVNADISTTAAIALSKIASTTAGKIIYSDGSDWLSLATGTSNQLLQMNSATDAPEWTSSINITGSVTIGGGTAISKHLSATTTVTLSITIGACSSTTTVGALLTGAAEGDTVIATPQKASVGVEDGALSWNAYIDTADEATLRVCNVSTTTAGTITAQTWRFDVWKH